MKTGRQTGRAIKRLAPGQQRRERPALGSMLYAVTLPPAGGETCFCDLAGAYEALPETRRAELEGLRAVHSYAHFNGTWSEPTSDEQTRRTPDVTHPVVRTHPETGRKALYIDPGMTPMIEGLDSGHSRRLLDELFEWSTRREFMSIIGAQRGSVLES